jgi:YYY domain-containing protein
MGPLVVWWLVLEGLGLITVPLTFRLFSARADHGYAFGKILALLLIAYVSWLASHAGLPLHLSLPLTVAVFVGLNLWLAWNGRQALGEWLNGPGPRAMLTHDLLWTAGFLFFAWQRSLGPEIFGAEKYMDFAFFNTLTRTDVMPPQDMWMAGQPFNYYYFGYLIFADLARLTPVSNHIAYNLCVVTVGGLAFGEVAAIGLAITRRLAFALITGVMTMVIGNLDGVLQLWEKHGFTQFDYWRSSRIVAHGDTINEFPYFTTIHGDLHPHFIVLPVTILLLGLLLDPERAKRVVNQGPAQTFRDLWPYVPVTFVLASMVVISPWELPVGAMITFLLLGRDLPLWPLGSWARVQLALRMILMLGLRVVVMLVVAYVLYLPFYLRFAAPPGGVGYKFAQTSLLEFLVVFGGLLLPAALLLVTEVRAKLSISQEQAQLLGAGGVLLTLVAYLAGNAVFVVLLGLGGAALVCAYASEDSERRAPFLLLLGASIALLACELVYIKDPYGDKLYRMNTVFKLYFQSWILLSIAAPWCWAQLVDRQRVPAGLRSLAAMTVGSLVVASCAYPVGITVTRLHNRVVASTLDGTEYLSREHPDDFAAIKWMRETIGDLPVVLEATGDPYSYYARFSSNTGLPTVMGWGNHEGLWRNNDRQVAGRRADVVQMYNASTLADAAALLDQYQVKYVVVGELERKDYQAAGLAKFAQLPVAFSRGGTTVYRR